MCDIVDREQLVELIIAHGLRPIVFRVGLVTAVDVGDDFPDGPILDSAKIDFQLGCYLDYFGASEASIFVEEPVSGASAGPPFPESSSGALPTGSSGTPNITARTTS